MLALQPFKYQLLLPFGEQKIQQCGQLGRPGAPRPCCCRSLFSRNRRRTGGAGGVLKGGRQVGHRHARPAGQLDFMDRCQPRMPSSQAVGDLRKRARSRYLQPPEQLGADKEKLFQILALRTRFPIPPQEFLAVQLDITAGAQGQNGWKTQDQRRVLRSGQGIQDQQDLRLRYLALAGCLQDRIQDVDRFLGRIRGVVLFETFSFSISITDFQPSVLLLPALSISFSLYESSVSEGSVQGSGFRVQKSKKSIRRNFQSRPTRANRVSGDQIR